MSLGPKSDGILTVHQWIFCAVPNSFLVSPEACRTSAGAGKGEDWTWAFAEVARMRTRNKEETNEVFMSVGREETSFEVGNALARFLMD